jgi:hypothetical protein
MSWAIYTIIFILAFVVAVYLSMSSGSRYSMRDAASHASDYAGVIKEAHGPITVFLYVSYVVILLWTFIYLSQHWHEFA